jgi:HPr kinase/phosphorylase
MNGRGDLKIVTNHHCTVVSLNGIGVMLTGASGSGKTSLAFSLIEAMRPRDGRGLLVADDQAILVPENGALLLAKAPPTIKGKAEVYGLGIVTVPSCDEVQIRIVAQLLPATEIERLPDSSKISFAGIDIPKIDVPSNDEARATRMILAKLGML